MKNSHISWTDHTFNPWEGCTKVSPGCAHCYAEARNSRFGGGTAPNWGKGAPRRRTSAANWREPLAWNRAAEAGMFREFYDADGKTVIYRGDMRDKECPDFTGERKCMPVRPRVFCASLADWLDDEVPVEWLADLLALWFACEHIDILALTKRPELWRQRVMHAAMYMAGYRDGQTSENPTAPAMPGWEIAWAWIRDGTPPANVWIGWTVENQEMADARNPHGLAIPALVHFVSAEPLLGAVDLRPLIDGQRGPVSWLETGCTDARIDWVICGGESGTKARPTHPDWARSLRDQCKAAGVAFHFKQWGEWAPTVSYMPTPWGDAGKLIKAFIICSTNRKQAGTTVYHAHPSAWDEARAGKAETMHKVGKLAAGRLLDGVEHNAVPEGAR